MAGDPFAIGANCKALPLPVRVENKQCPSLPIPHAVCLAHLQVSLDYPHQSQASIRRDRTITTAHREASLDVKTRDLVLRAKTKLLVLEPLRLCLAESILKRFPIQSSGKNSKQHRPGGMATQYRSRRQHDGLRQRSSSRSPSNSV